MNWNFNFAGYWKFLKETKGGNAILCGIGLICLLMVMTLLFPEKKKADGTALIALPKTATKATTHLFSNDIDPIDAQKIEGSSSSAASQSNTSQNTLSSLIGSSSSTPTCPMRIYAAPEAPPHEEAQMSSSALPYGRLVKCVLVNTVDSSRIATPIIGMVTEDVWQGGVCIIPAGTEVHGTAQIDYTRERIASEKEWIMVWQDGKELSVKGIALSNTQHGTEQKWGITDGSAGLEGEILKSDKLAQLKEILATTVAAAGSGLVPVTTTTSPFGNTQVATTGNAQAVLGESIQAAGRVYAEQIMESIKRDGWFVRCKAGSSFYLYTLEPIDLANARIGSSQSNKH